MSRSISVMDPHEVRRNDRTNKSRQQQPMSLSSTENDGSSDTLGSPLGMTAVTADKEIDNISLRLSSLDPTTSHTQNYRDGKNSGGAISSQNRTSLASMSAQKMRQAERMEMIESLRPTIETVLSRASPASNPGPGPVTQRAKLTRWLTAGLSRRATVTGDNRELRGPQQQNADTIGTPTSTKLNTTTKRVQRYGEYLTVPKRTSRRSSKRRHSIHNGQNSHKERRCQKCTWTLLPWSPGPPDIPVIAVTDSEGLVRYPYDFTRYSSDIEDDSSDSLDDSD
ncbi:hypothetical protein F5Y06DRAFT_36798 [Hypoxylon sp. FL0890]|nr:hypothetical protein F5Y06DRAFT_36798 [Hypoxylon sp. FL0890]